MKISCTLGSLILLVGSLLAEEKKVNLSEFQLGQTLAGTEITAETVKGHPTVIDYWGIHCGPCLAHIPFFSSLAKRYDGKGLVLIGAHCQDATDAEVLAVVKSQKIKFPVTKGTNGPIQFSTIPHTAVFAADGTLLFHGHPDDKEFDRALKTAMKDAPAATVPTGGKATAASTPAKTDAGPLVASRPWTNAEGKPVTAALVSIKDGVGTFRKADGNTFTYALEKLSASDQDTIAKAVEAKH